MTDEKQKLIKELCEKIGELRAVVQQSLDQMGELVTRLEFLRAGEDSPPQQRYLCERCGGSGRQPGNCWTGLAYDSKPGICDDCLGEGLLGPVK